MKKSVVGILLVLVGLLFLLVNLNLLPELPNYIYSWPMLFILIAVVQLISGKSKQALIFFLIGGFFLLQQFNWIDMRIYWPILLVLVGLIFLFRDRDRRVASDQNNYRETNIFGGSEKLISSKAFKSGTTTNLFGGSTVDLRQAQLDSPATIDLFVMFGGCEIQLPEGWHVKNDVTAILGGFSDERKSDAHANGPTLLIKGFVMFGGVEVTN